MSWPFSQGFTSLSEGIWIDEKIPSELRDRIPVLADGNRVMWVIGYRISSDYKIDEATKRVFQAELPDSEERKLPAKRKD